MESAPMYLLSDEMATASITSSCALQVDDSMTSTIAIAAKYTVFILLLLFHGPASKKQKKEKKNRYDETVNTNSKNNVWSL